MVCTYMSRYPFLSPICHEVAKIDHHHQHCRSCRGDPRRSRAAVYLLQEDNSMPHLHGIHRGSYAYIPSPTDAESVTDLALVRSLLLSEGVSRAHRHHVPHDHQGHDLKCPLRDRLLSHDKDQDHDDVLLVLPHRMCHTDADCHHDYRLQGDQHSWFRGDAYCWQPGWQCHPHAGPRVRFPFGFSSGCLHGVLYGQEGGEAKKRQEK